MPLMTFTSSATDGGDFVTTMSPPIDWVRDVKIKASLVRATVCRAWPTIATSLRNNKIFYRDNNGDPHFLTINDGQYTFGLLNDVLHKFMESKNHYVEETVNGAVKKVYFIDIGANVATGRIVLTVRNSFILDIAPLVAEEGQYDLREVLGFTDHQFVGGDNPLEFEGDKIPDFNGGITEVHIRSNIIKGSSSYSNGKMAPIVYTFTPDKMPHSYMIIEPYQRIYHDLARNSFDSVRIWLTDQDGKPLTTGGERTTVVLDVATA